LLSQFSLPEPQNVLIDRRGNVKIGDWGLARTTAAQMKTITHEVATLWYRVCEFFGINWV